MNVLNDEQQVILNYAKTDVNIIVDSVAGTGKTTIILSFAKEMPDKNLLLITYNAALKIEVRNKVETLGLKNIKVHTYHSLAKGYYSSNAHEDSGLKDVVLKNLPPMNKLLEIDILVVDEVQDMTITYYRLLLKYLTDLGKPIQVIILGDYMQGLYDFKGADTRFLTLGQVIWENRPFLKSNEFKRCTMKTSYRITNQMCNFINNVMIGGERMKAVKDGCQVQYIRNSLFNLQTIVYFEIMKLFEMGVKPNEIFVLAGSVKGERSVIRVLENMLVEKGVPCHVPMLENTSIDDRISNGKVVFSTFHSSKGRERPYVFVVGFDNSYFKFNARGLPRDVCPNTLYVGCTRGSKGLYLLESDSFRDDRPLEFLKMSHVEMKNQDYIQFRGMHQSVFPPEPQQLDTMKSKKITPTELTKFISDATIDKITPILERVFITEIDSLEEINIPSVLETKRGFFEEVSDLNGIAIPCIYYDFLAEAWNIPKEQILFELIDVYTESINDKKQSFLKKIIDELPERLETISDYLYASNALLAMQESLYFKLCQIDRDEYTWLNDSVIELCKHRMKKYIGADCQNKMPEIEEYIIIGSNEDQHQKIDNIINENMVADRKYRFSARSDIITENIVWELKCTRELSIENKLQLVIYAWLWRNRTNHTEDEKMFKLFNIRTGELLRLDATNEELTFIVIELIKSKFRKTIPKTDEEFIAECLETVL
jgi:hypothetical protein